MSPVVMGLAIATTVAWLLLVGSVSEVDLNVMQDISPPYSVSIRVEVASAVYILR